MARSVPEVRDEVVAHHRPFGMAVEWYQRLGSRRQRVRPDRVEGETRSADPFAERSLTGEGHVVPQLLGEQGERYQRVGVSPATDERHDHSHSAILTARSDTP